MTSLKWQLQHRPICASLSNLLRKHSAKTTISQMPLQYWQVVHLLQAVISRFREGFFYAEKRGSKWKSEIQKQLENAMPADEICPTTEKTARVEFFDRKLQVQQAKDLKSTNTNQVFRKPFSNSYLATYNLY